VDENLVMGGYTRSDRAGLRRDHDLCFEYFPRLKERRKRLAGHLSGGEQQMVAIGRAMMSEPKVLLLDEPSLGLAPKIVAEIADAVRRINVEEKRSVILVEQNARLALRLAHRAYVMEQGQITRSGSGAQLLADPAVQSAYLGV
jgi:branched-chain amino acid transport system ATP-binding protein